MANKNKAKYGYLSYSDIFNRIQEGKLDAYDVVFTKDTKEAVVITPELDVFSIKSKVYVFDSVLDAINMLNAQSDTYVGQIVSIKQDDTYRGYVVNKENDNFIVVPLWECPDGVDYNTLGNRPIYNLVGTLDNPIFLNDLSDGVYSVTGQYKITDNDVTVFLTISPTLIFISHTDEHKILIKRVSSFEIKDYIVDNSMDKQIVSVDSYLTDSYLKKSGYITESDVDKKLAVLKAEQESELKQYIQSSLSEQLDDMILEKIEDKLDEKFEEKIERISNDDITNLFLNN